MRGIRRILERVVIECKNASRWDAAGFGSISDGVQESWLDDDELDVRGAYRMRKFMGRIGWIGSRKDTSCCDDAKE
jgi:hypothetical protein